MSHNQATRPLIGRVLGKRTQPATAHRPELRPADDAWLRSLHAPAAAQRPARAALPPGHAAEHAAWDTGMTAALAAIEQHHPAAVETTRPLALPRAGRAKHSRYAFYEDADQATQAKLDRLDARRAEYEAALSPDARRMISELDDYLAQHMRDLAAHRRFEEERFARRDARVVEATRTEAVEVLTHLAQLPDDQAEAGTATAAAVIFQRALHASSGAAPTDSLPRMTPELLAELDAAHAAGGAL